MFYALHRIASELCLVTASQVDSKRIRPNSDINQPMSKTVRFLFPLNEDLLKPIFQTKEDGVIKRFLLTPSSLYAEKHYIFRSLSAVKILIL